MCTLLQRSQGIEALFAIQAQTLPFGLAGFDVVGRARTGCGKTLGFTLPIVERILIERKEKPGATPQLGRSVRHASTIVMAPTRELAMQVGPSPSCMCVPGGMGKCTPVFACDNKCTNACSPCSGVHALACCSPRPSTLGMLLLSYNGPCTHAFA